MHIGLTFHKIHWSYRARLVLRRCLINIRGHIVTSLSLNCSRVPIDELVLKQARIGRLRIDWLHRQTLLLSELSQAIPHTLLGRVGDMSQSLVARLMILLSWYFARGWIGCHRFLSCLTFYRDPANGDNLALRHLLLLSPLYLFPSPRLVGCRQLIDRSCGRPVLLLPVRLAHEWFQRDLLIEVFLQSSFLQEGIFFQTGHPLCRSFVSYDEALRTGISGAIAIVEAPCQLDVGHDAASRRLLFLQLALQVFPQRSLSRCLGMTMRHCFIVFFSLDQILGADASLTNSYCTLILICWQCLAASLES